MEYVGLVHKCKVCTQQICRGNVKFLILLAAMIGMGAGAWHSYQQRNLLIQAALFSEAFALSASVKSQVSDHYFVHDVMPHDNAAAGLPPAKSIYGTSVKRVSVNRSGLVMVDFADEIGLQSMVFTPSVSPVSGYIEWRCTSDSIDQNVLELLKPNCSYISATNEGQLINAIANKNIVRVQQLLETGVNTDVVVNGNTPLMLAAKVGDIDVVKLLIGNGASVDNNALNSERRTPLMVAINSDKADVVSFLLAEGASVTRRDYKGLSAQEHAVNTDRRLGGERYELMVLARLNPAFAGTPQQRARKQRTSAQQAAHMDALYIQLTQAATNCRVQRIASLLKAENDYDTSELVAGLALSSHTRKPECSQVLTTFIKTKATYTAALESRFAAASSSCDQKAIELLMQKNPELDIMAQTQLHSHFDQAVYSGCSNLVSHFIRTGNLKGKISGGVLLNAIQKSPQETLVELVGSLIEAGVDVNYTDQSGEMPLAAAIALEQPVVAKYLVDAGANVNEITTNNSYPLIEASKKGFNHLASQLIREGADIDQQDSLGRTALVAAVATGRRRLVDTLLRAGASAMDKDNNGISAMMLAESKNLRQIYSQLTASASNDN